ncbi:hypothetical protein IRZ49_00800 [Pseudomonas fulva]|nr:hypothetical protein [Pseudomonas fulva]MBF8716092.1 hypothetical protein [Pseudomonas fulva]MBF8782760.1 hypothetical protein [Pseudomonas fulva]
MPLLYGPTEDMELVIGDRLEAMLSQQPQALQFRTNDTVSLGLVVAFHGFHGLRV